MGEISPKDPSSTEHSLTETMRDTYCKGDAHISRKEARDTNTPGLTVRTFQIVLDMVSAGNRN